MLALPMLFLAFFGIMGMSSAQVISPTIGFPQVNVSAFSAAGNDDVVTNCDMLEAPTGDIERPNGMIKAVAWSNWPGGTTTTNSVGGFYVEDYNGNSLTQTLPVGSLHPDIVLANVPGNDEHPYNYQVLVVYFTFDNGTTTASSSSTNNVATLDIYDIADVGMPSIHLVPRQVGVPLTTFASCGWPHIDMWSDAQNPVDGFPGMHKFAVTFTDNYPTADWYVYINDVASFNTFATPTYLGTSNIFMPDLACLTDNTSGTPVELIEFTYADGYSDPLIRTAYANRLQQVEYDPALSSFTYSPIAFNNWQVFAPRIEAMSQYDSSRTRYARWEIASSQIQSTVFGVFGYNDLTGTTPTDMSSLLSPLYPVPPNYTYTAMGATVGGGVGPSLGTSGIGNRQYTTGFFPWQHDSVYARDVDVTNGTLITSASCYQINNNPTPVVYPWDVNQSLSISNSSNSGNDILAAWHDGTNVVYKLSTFNATTRFRMAPSGVGNTFIRKGAYPNPTTDYLHYAGADGQTYKITDITGREVMSGVHGANAIDVRSLSNGMYLLNTYDADKRMESVKFTKQ